MGGFERSQTVVALEPLRPNGVMMENTYPVHLSLTMDAFNQTGGREGGRECVKIRG